LPEVAETWWLQLTKRFPNLALPTTPSDVQVGLLSLTLSIGLSSRRWQVFAPAVERGDWNSVADAIEAMANTEPIMARMPGLKRRRLGEAALVRSALH
jgi:GH24 family phage-related lysozyme (muramidase)